MSSLSSRIVTVTYLLLLALTAGCDREGSGLQNTIISRETHGPSLTQQSAELFAPAQTPRPTLTSTPRPPAVARPTNQPTSAPTPSPLYPLDLSGYDPDLYGTVDVLHNPPLIAGADEMVGLVFDFANKFCMQYPIDCIPDGILYYSYGPSESFQTVALAYEIVGEVESLVARLPATDPEGNSLRYYAEFTVPEVGYITRYPGAGTIDLFTTEQLIPVKLPAEKEAQPGEVVYDFFWGYGPDQVSQATYEDYPQRVGPPAMEVSNDGRIAILDPVNERIILYKPEDGSYSSYPMPFTYRFWADLAFDREGWLMVCDYEGEENEATVGPDPYCYLMSPEGELLGSAPVYVRSPAKITKDLRILDNSDARLIAPFNSEGTANPREVQRQKETWDLPKRFIEGQDPDAAYFADRVEGLAFEVRSISPLGGIMDFEKTPQGYILIFSGEGIRAVWIDPTGRVLKDVTLPNGRYSEINFNGQTAVGQDGSLYVMSSTERGIEIHSVDAP